MHRNSPLRHLRPDDQTVRDLNYAIVNKIYGGPGGVH
jgi:hypothetical protein